MVCWNTFTTGIPRTNSTASLFIFSSAVMYPDIKSALSPPIIFFKKNTLIASGIKQQIPSLQSKTNNKLMTATGITTAPVRSGNWCARNPSVSPALSSIIFRSLPLAFWLKYPSGNVTIWCIASFFILVAVRNAARCEQHNATKYNKILSNENATASHA